MAGQIGYNGFRVMVRDKNSSRILTNCVVVATYNDVKYNLPYDQSHSDYRLEVANVSPIDTYALEVTCDGYYSYAASLVEASAIHQVELSPKIPILEQLNKLQKNKE